MRLRRAFRGPDGPNRLGMQFPRSSDDFTVVRRLILYMATSRTGTTRDAPVGSTSDASKSANVSDTRARALGLLAWMALALMWFATAQVRPLLDPDEGRYAEIPREIVATGDWITPRLNDLKYFEKPPLQYWATAEAYRAFGISEWSSRLWSLGLAFACLPLVYGWTRRLYGEHAGRAALLALAVSPYFAIVGHINLLDAGFTFWLTGAVFAFTLAQRSSPGSMTERRWMLTAWLAAALAVLSKGIVVGVLAGASLVAYSLLERDTRVWRRLHWLSGIPVFLCVAAPWFVLVSLRNPDFARFFFVHEHFARYLTTVHQRFEPWWYFIPIILSATFPWIVSFMRVYRQAWGEQEPDVPFKPLKFVLIFAAITFLFFSASGSKLAAYVLPVIPALAAVLGALAVRDPALASRAARTGAVAMITVALALLMYSWHRNGIVPIDVILWCLAAMLVSVVGMLGVRSAGPPLGPQAVLAVAASAILGWQFLLTAYSMTPPTRSARDLAAAVEPYVRHGTPLYSVGQFRHTLLPYLRRTLTVVGYTGELQFGLNAEPGRSAATAAEFIARWTSGASAVAFFEPSEWPRYQERHFPGHVIAADSETIVVSRR